MLMIFIEIIGMTLNCITLWSVPMSSHCYQELLDTCGGILLETKQQLYMMGWLGPAGSVALHSGSPKDSSCKIECFKHNQHLILLTIK